MKNASLQLWSLYQPTAYVKEDRSVIYERIQKFSN